MQQKDNARPVRLVRADQRLVLLLYSCVSDSDFSTIFAQPAHFCCHCFLSLPEFINLVGLNQLHLFVLVVAVHGVLFLYVLVNFSIATFMDPGRLPKGKLIRSFSNFLLLLNLF